MVAVALALVGCGEVSEEGAAETTAVATTVATSPDDSTDLAPTQPGDAAEPVPSTTTTSPSEEQPDDSKTPEPVPQPSGEPVTGEVPQDMMTSVMTDLVSRTGAAQGDITTVRAEQAIWNDGSLGCALPGESYTQALVDGFWVVFEYAGTTYDYRASTSGFFKLCEGGGLPPSNPTG